MFLLTMLGMICLGQTSLANPHLLKTEQMLNVIKQKTFRQVHGRDSHKKIDNFETMIAKQIKYKDINKCNVKHLKSTHNSYFVYASPMSRTTAIFSFPKPITSNSGIFRRKTASFWKKQSFFPNVLDRNYKSNRSFYLQNLNMLISEFRAHNTCLYVNMEPYLK